MDYTNESQMADSFLPFDPIVLVQDVAKRFLLILLAVLAVGVGSYVLTDMSYEPVYQTNTTFVATSRGSSTTVYTNLSSASSVATVFSELLNSSLLRKNILQELGTTSFDGAITAAAIPETNLLTMKVTASDPRTAFLVAQAIIDHHETITYQVVDGVTLEVLQSPVVPTGPANYADAMGQMKKMMVLTFAAMCALLAWLSFARDTVRSSGEAEKKLDCAFLGEIPHEEKYKTLISRLHKRKTSILITNPVTSFRFVETVRKLRRRVEQHMQGGKVLMVTSLLENEGKSTVAVNLALAMAQKYKRVLLIDCDLRKPACHAILEQKIPGGLRDVLTDKAQLTDVLMQYKRTNLYVLLEKKSDRNSGDLLSSQDMADLLDWARGQFDFIVLDLPPMSVSSDAELMTDRADASLLVVRQNVALAGPLNRSIAALEGGKAKLLGCVLNNVWSTRLTSGQGVGYGYGYGSYGHYGNYDKRSGKK